MVSLSLALAAAAAAATVSLAQTTSDTTGCGPFTLSSPYGPLYLEPNGTLTTPYHGTSGLGTSTIAQFYIFANGTLTGGPGVFCSISPFFKCFTAAGTIYGSSINPNGTYFSDEDPRWYMTIGPPVEFYSAHGFNATAAHIGPFHTVQLVASACYANHTLNGVEAPSPTATVLLNGTSIPSSSANRAIAQDSPGRMLTVIGGALLGLLFTA